MFVEYPDNHNRKYWEMFNSQLKRTHTIEDVNWLQRMYFTYNHNKDELSFPIYLNRISSSGDIKAGEGQSQSQQQTNKDNNDQCDHDDSIASVSSIQRLFNTPKEESENDKEENNPTDCDDVRDPFSAIAREREEEIVHQNDPATQNEGFRTVTRSRRSSNCPRQLIEDPEFGQTRLVLAVEQNYYAALMEIGSMAVDTIEDQHYRHMSTKEVACIGFALGGRFKNTTELKPMKYDETMATKNKKQWGKV